ncbi:MAG: PorP/SprF family type IX secretion system membrane protein [Bacteroidaceae bacterium]|nr:PorP/SprF family type IX secretion system membrane protein [Bacteroidaceae bacterium]
MVRTLLTISFLVVLCGNVKAQYDVSFSHYFDMEPSFNPAAVGKDAKLNIVAAYALDFAGYEHNPQTLYAGADMALQFFGKRHGVGVLFINDAIGLFSHKRISVQYSLKIGLFGGTLGIGVQPGLLNEKFKGSEADPETPVDPIFSGGDMSGNAFDLGVGVHYQHNQWYAAISVQHLTAPTILLGDKTELNVPASFYFNAGYNIKLRNPFITIVPSVLVRTDWSDHREDITCRVIYTNDKKMFYGGIGYSINRSATVYLGALIKGFNVGYSYEIYTSSIKPGNGSHELMIGYQMDVNLSKKGRNLHKSVRLL